MPINLFSAETYFYYIYDIYTCRFDIISGRWYFHLEGGIKKSVMGTLLLWIIVLASLEWNASLYDSIFVEIFNKKYLISSRYSTWLCHLLRFFAKAKMIILGRKNHTFIRDKFGKDIFTEVFQGTKF